ncbi:MAG: carbon-nitrogen hydrolase family protein [Pseudomonadales bacterium]|nr:carbon-nitrogen hydrolase family protein [Pseudomonadales bacterium]
MNHPRKTLIAALQNCAGPDVEANLAVLDTLGRDAAGAGAEVLFIPEAFAYLGPDDGKQRILEPLPEGGPILERCQQLASATRTHVILGGFHERTNTPGKAYNTCVHLDPDGTIVRMYRKIHLFDVALADGTRLEESARTLPGDKAVTTELPYGTHGLTICYDVRFPALFQQLADMGAIAMSVPSAFTATTGKAHWHVLLRARAIEAQSYVIAPAQHGHNWGKRRSYGHSLIIDPWGQVLAELPEGDGFITAEIDPAEVQRVRSELPSLTHKRTFSPD